MSKEMNCNKLYCVTTRSFHLISYEAKWTCVKSRFFFIICSSKTHSILPTLLKWFHGVQKWTSEKSRTFSFLEINDPYLSKSKNSFGYYICKSIIWHWYLTFIYKELKLIQINLFCSLILGIPTVHCTNFWRLPFHPLYNWLQNFACHFNGDFCNF